MERTQNQMYTERNGNMVGGMAKNNFAGCSGPFAGCEGWPIAMAYVPMQQWQNIYKAETALMKGTIFPELYLPFLGKEAVQNGR